jgi:flagellar assembly factor FliW
MKIETQMFGTVVLEEDKIFSFQDGLLGFEDLKHFVLIEAEELKPIAWLVSIDEPEVAFPLADARFFVENYEVAITKEDREVLDVNGDDDVAIYTIVSLPTEEKPLTANLRGPVVINLSSRLGRQVVLRDERYSHRQTSLADRAGVATT